MITVSLPPVIDRAEIERLIGGRVTARLIGWDFLSPPEGADPADIDVVVSPFHTTSPTPNPTYVGIPALAASLPLATNARLVQLLSLGSEGVATHLPPHAVLANAAGAMEHQTAELACTLLLAASRGIPAFAQQATWANSRSPGLWGKRVVVLGHGGIGREVVRRLAPFEAEIVCIARTGRTLHDGTVIHPVSVLAEIVQGADALICTVPLSSETAGLVDAGILAALADGAIVVNVGRGPVVHTEALVAELTSGRLSAALDVTDPEPLPDGHALWDLPNALVTPHVGGNTDAMRLLLHRLVAEQIVRVGGGDDPENIILNHSSIGPGRGVPTKNALKETSR
ncbi:NAD(P)-dependent oxidoreductase [Microbacterium murale]|uniref:NAD(P)-dependent oxidoreductase n=1 Tax=Microbacterium murale TaxID=1081040 RepID=UPI0016645FBA|nr:NAD(P)-dependent oxidoreductase [Microbacterium murale]